MRTIFRKVAIRYTHRQASAPCHRPQPVRQAGRALVWVLLIVLAACSGADDAGQQETVLIRNDRQVVTLARFERAFSAARIAYSDDSAVDPELIRQARVRLLHEMIEEVMVERRAEELGIVLDEPELEAAIQKFKKDYPADEFEQMLLESAIPYALWKDRLRMRLLMEKVVDRDLVQPLNITAQEIEAYYKAHEDEFAVDAQEIPEMELKHRILERLRRQKVEAAYRPWMEELRQRYGIEINWELWEKSYGADAEADGEEKQ